MQILPSDITFRLKSEMTSFELSDALRVGSQDRQVRFVPLQDGKLSVLDSQGSIIGIWEPSKEEFDTIKAFSDESLARITRVRSLYYSALEGGEPQDSNLARDLREARTERVPRPIKTQYEALDL